MLQPYCPPEDLYLAFLVYRLPEGDLEDLITYLKFSRTIAQVLRDTLELKNELPDLAELKMTQSRIYRGLHQYSQTAILANLIISDSPLIRQRIELYLNQLRHVKTALTGEDLMALGVASGPRIKEVLEALREARLDGEVTTGEAEREMVKKMIKATV